MSNELRGAATVVPMREIDVAWCIAGADLTEPRLSPDGSTVGYVHSGPGGSALLLQSLDGGPVRQLSSFPPPKPGRGLGGGCWAWSPDGGAIVYSANDGQLWWQPLGGAGLRCLTAHDSGGARAPSFSPDGGRVVYQLEDAEIHWVAIDGRSSGRLDDGSDDFCMDPWATVTGALWQAWSVPDMAWDGSVVTSAAWDGTAGDRWRVNGAIQQPRLVGGRLWWVSDETGWLNVSRDRVTVVSETFEHAGPTWGPGQRSYAVSPDGDRVAFTRNESGFGRLCLADLDGGQVAAIGRGVHGQLTWAGERICALRSGARTPTEIVVYELGDDSPPRRSTIAVGPVSGWAAAPLSEPEAVMLGAVPARLYRATTDSERLLVWIHGGPTDQWPVSFLPRIAYWCSRGWNVLVPDPRGSSGHGRAFQQALRGGWGVADVDDICSAIDAAIERGWGTAATTVLCGGSSGGYAVLEALARPTTAVAAAMVSYPVSDLLDLAERSHRYERHYTDTLVGARPAADAELLARSPVNHAAGLAGTPLLILHGDQDPVVPVEQSQALAAAIEKAGGAVELHVYPGEGHGFRDPLNKLDEYRRMGEFLDRHVAASVDRARR